MVIYRVLNNNSVVSVDRYGREVVLMGKGIGFGVKKGDLVNPDRVSTLFVVSSMQVV